VITFLDVFAVGEQKVLLEQFEGHVVGFWFLGPTRKGKLWNRIFSRKERRAFDLMKDMRSLPKNLRQVFLVDESIQARIGSRPGFKVTILPDPWPIQCMAADKVKVREKYGLPLDRRIFLHFGSTDCRKGIDDVVEAWQNGRRPAGAFLLRAGRTRPRLVDRLLSLPDTMLINRYVSDNELDELLVAADWVLLPYREHAGSSGSLSGAAAARRPVICSDFGVLGDRVRNHGLGLVFKHLDVNSFVDCLCEACRLDCEIYSDALQQFSAKNSLSRFQEILRSEFLKLLAKASR